jgi:glycine dehydrogenase
MAKFQQVVDKMSPSDIHNIPNRSLFDASDDFGIRHLGSSDFKKMCDMIGVESVDELIKQTIPSHVCRDLAEDPIVMDSGAISSESGALSTLKAISEHNIVGTNFIGQGYYGTITPAVIQRNLFENPAWYTAYTPYQAEISQGRLEALFIYQTLVSNLTGMEVSNCSLLDEGTSAAEAMAMFARGSNLGGGIFFISDKVHPQTISVVKTRAEWMGIEICVGDVREIDFKSINRLLGALLQFPDTTGRLVDYSSVISGVKAAGGKVCVAADPLALTVCEPPKGVDALVGTMQRFGVPLLYGGPHAGFLATSLANVRRMPGRLIGESVDAHGRPAYRLTLQTREQHIRLDKATSNICTSQALLANMSAMYAVYHGPAGLQRIAMKCHGLAQLFYQHISRIEEFSPISDEFFDTVAFQISPMTADFMKETLAEEFGINIRRLGNDILCVSFDETHDLKNVEILVEALKNVADIYKSETTGSLTMSTGVSDLHPPEVDGIISQKFARISPLLPQAIFNSIQTETEMMRYLYRLQLKDLSLTSSMISLGSCTMKLNSVSSLLPVLWEKFSNIHPFAPRGQTKGYRIMLQELSEWLSSITGFDGCSLQPMSGASGEYAGLLAIRKYYQSIGEGDRNIVIIPRSAHGTNPASAAMMGMQIKWIDDAGEGGIDVDEFEQLCQDNSDRLAALMITYPSTHGIFDHSIKKLCDIVHEYGGNVYMDGANMNAQLGLTSPGLLGADVCHLNLHKTFSIPHGGGGPGLGPICVRSHLAPFLPGHPEELGTNDFSVSSAPFGQAGIAVIPWMFIKMLGQSGLVESGRQAILNANYMASRLRDHYPIPYLNSAGRCSHEFIIDISEIKETTGIGEEDIAKRLMDYGFHAPTMSWPVHNSLMIEPTESENIGELDRFVDALLSIRNEIKKIESGEWDKLNNPLKNAPHTQSMVCDDEWNFPYSRKIAAFPLQWISERGKFWPSVSRVSNTVGDKKLILTLKD